MKSARDAFTLLELVMVILIIGVLAALAVPQYVNFVEKARAVEAINYIGAIKLAALTFIVETNSTVPLSSPQQLRMTDDTPL